MHVDLALRWAALAVIPLVLTACDELLGEGDDGGGGAGGRATTADGGGGHGGGAPAPARFGVAARLDQLPAGSEVRLCRERDMCELDRASVVLFIEDAWNRCSDPFALDRAPQGELWWIALAPSAQAVGQYGLGTEDATLGNEHGASDPSGGMVIDVVAYDPARVQVRTRGVFTPDALFEFTPCATVE